MVQHENSSRQDIDHFLLARGPMKGCEAELSDLREWIQKAIVEVKDTSQRMEDTGRSDVVRRRARGILDRVKAIDLSEFKEYVNNLETVMDSVKSRDYQSVFEVRTQLEREMMRLRDMAREIFDMRSTLDLLSQEEPQPTVDDFITILFLTADPTDASRLRLGEEHREVQEKLRLASNREKFGLVQRMAVRPQDITQAILDEKPTIVHFSGHGTINGGLCFENEIGESTVVEPDALAELFELVSDHVDCVILSACYSKLQAEAISSHITHVIGMNQAIGDEAAIAFAVGFYQALGAGKSIEDSYEFGRVQIVLKGIPEGQIPVLLTAS